MHGFMHNHNHLNYKQFRFYENLLLRYAKLDRTLPPLGAAENER